MILNKRKQNELERLAYFGNLNVNDFTDEDIKQFFDYSEKGIGDGGKIGRCKWAQGVTLMMWEESFYKKDMSWLGYNNLIRDENGKLLPDHIIDFIKKELFNGIDASIIEECKKPLI